MAQINYLTFLEVRSPKGKMSAGLFLFEAPEQNLAKKLPVILSSCHSAWGDGFLHFYFWFR